MKKPPSSDSVAKIPRLTPELSRFIEGMGMYFENQGIPRIGGRMLGLLMIAHRPLSAEDLARILKVSRASLSTNFRSLPGQRSGREGHPPRGSHHLLRLLRRGHGTPHCDRYAGRNRFQKAGPAGPGRPSAQEPCPPPPGCLAGVVRAHHRRLSAGSRGLAASAHTHCRALGRSERSLAMQLYLRLAWRNIWRHRRRTVIIILAMGLSLAMMMWYDGMIDGFNQAIYGNAIRVLGGNIQIHAAGYREKIDSNPLLPLPNDAAVVQDCPVRSRGHLCRASHPDRRPGQQPRGRLPGQHHRHRAGGRGSRQPGRPEDRCRPLSDFRRRRPGPHRSRPG